MVDLQVMVFREKVRTHEELAGQAIGRGDLEEYQRQLGLMFEYWNELCLLVGYY